MFIGAQFAIQVDSAGLPVYLSLYLPTLNTPPSTPTPTPTHTRGGGGGWQLMLREVWWSTALQNC